MGEIAGLLLEHNADASITDSNGNSVADYDGNAGVVELLASQGLVDADDDDDDDAEDVEADDIASEFARTAAAEQEAERVRAQEEEDAEFEAILQADAEEEDAIAKE